MNTTNEGILSNPIFEDIKGKHKYLFDRNESGAGTGGEILRAFLASNNVKMESQSGFVYRYASIYNKTISWDKKREIKNIPLHTFINEKFIYKETEMYLSVMLNNKIPTADHGYTYTIVLSTDTYIEDIKRFIMVDAVKYYVMNVREQDEEGKIQIYTFDDGYWEHSRYNNQRDTKSIFINDNVYSKIINDLDRFSDPKTKKIYKRLGLPYKFNVLLYGPPGTGKTSFIEIIASKYNRSVRYMHVTPKIKDNDFAKALTSLGKKDILVCEDIDCLFVDRKSSDKDKNAMTFSGLLNAFDGITGGKEGLIVFMTTNHKCNLDEALLRPGRIDNMSEFAYMDRECMEKMIKFYFEEDFNQNDFDRFADIFENKNVTGAILSNFLLNLLLKKEFKLYENRKSLQSLLKENDYESKTRLSAQLYA